MSKRVKWSDLTAEQQAEYTRLYDAITAADASGADDDTFFAAVAALDEFRENTGFDLAE